MPAITDLVAAAAAITSTADGLAAAVDAITSTASGLGATDCELPGDGSLAQPTNALSSLAYVVVGLGIAGSAIRHRFGRNAGSAISHRFARTIRWSLVFGGLVTAIGIGSVLFHGPQPSGSQFLHDVPIGLTVLFVVLTERRALLHRGVHDLRAAGPSWPAIGALAAAAVTAWVLGRSGSPACDPTSAFQFHGIWHLLSATVLGLWWMRRRGW